MKKNNHLILIFLLLLLSSPVYADDFKEDGSKNRGTTEKRMIMVEFEGQTFQIVEANKKPFFNIAVVDRNFDGKFTIRDVYLWFKWLFFYPGDWLLTQIITNFKSLAIFFEISEKSYGGLGSGIISLISWIIGLIIFGIFMMIFGLIIVGVDGWLDIFIKKNRL